jgi:predicted transcriptional regulator
MPRQASKTFTDKELEIMRVIWKLGEATVKDLQARLPGDRHYNSVLTIIRVLERKRHLTHRVEGRAHIYRPRVSHAQSSRRVLSHLVKHVFGGSASSLVLHLVETSDLSAADLREIRERLVQRVKEKENQ